MEGKQPDEEKKDDPAEREEEDREKTRSNAAQRDTPLTKKKVKGLLGIVFFRQPLVPPGWPNSPNRAPFPARPCGLHGLPPMGWARSRGLPRRPVRAATPRYRCRSPRSLSSRPQLRRPRLPTANPGLVWPRSQRDCHRCRGSWISRGTSTEAVPATRTIGTTMEPEIFADTDAADHESLVLNRSGFWIRPPFAMPPAVVGSPHALQTAAGASIEGLEVPQREGSQRSRTNTLSRPSPRHCQDSVRGQSQESPSQESRMLHGCSTGSWQRSVGSIRSNREGDNLDEAIGGRFQGPRSIPEDDHSRHILATKERGLELSSVSYMVFLAALILVIFFVGVMMFMPDIGTPGDVGASRQRAVDGGNDHRCVFVTAHCKYH
ncbi:hypothetical protein MTO96_024196 [Rhipicephalus appendiculatus]